MAEISQKKFVNKSMLKSIISFSYYIKFLIFFELIRRFLQMSSFQYKF